MNPTAITPAPVPTLGLRIGRGRVLLGVATLADASRAYRAACLRHEIEKGQGSSTMPEGRVYDVTGEPRLVARVSWNGRVWPPGPWLPTMEPLYAPPSCAETGGAA